MNKIIGLMLLVSTAQADGLYLFGSIYAYDDGKTMQDYEGLSPNGEYGFYLKHEIDPLFSVSAGYKHSSSMKYREKGAGFNGAFFRADLKVISW